MTADVGVKIVRLRKRRRRRLSISSALLSVASLLVFGFAWTVLGLGLTTLLVLMLAALTVIISLAMVRYADVRQSIWTHSAPCNGKLRRSPATAHSTPQHDRGVRNPERLSLRLGSVILLIAALMVLGYSVPAEKYGEWAALAESPKPSACDWTTLPLGEKHCHYEPIFQHVHGSGDHITVTWQRVNGDD
jgi:hypothetical protein